MSSVYNARALVRITYTSPTQLSVCAPGWDPSVEWTYSLNEDTAPLFTHYDDRNEHNEVRVFATLNLAAETIEDLNFDFSAIEPVVPYLAR